MNLWTWIIGLFKKQGVAVDIKIETAWTGHREPASPKPFFSTQELEGLDERLIRKLIEARALAGIPFIITSGKRTPEENAQAGGVKNSAHEKGLAVDLRARTKVQKLKINAALKAVGFVRIGTYTAHIHCDLDDSKPQLAWAGGISHA